MQRHHRETQTNKTRFLQANSMKKRIFLKRVKTAVRFGTWMLMLCGAQCGSHPIASTWRILTGQDLTVQLFCFFFYIYFLLYILFTFVSIAACRGRWARYGSKSGSRLKGPGPRETKSSSSTVIKIKMCFLLFNL